MAVFMSPIKETKLFVICGREEKYDNPFLVNSSQAKFWKRLYSTDDDDDVKNTSI